ncbi:MAG: NADPH-dependent FMN reductase [Gammaproteobacteria bacterium]
MTITLKYLVFAGSTRKGSFNKQLAKVAEAKLKTHQVEVTYLDLHDLPMPLYDGDLEAEKGIPENAMKFREILKSHHAFLICSPEYNSSISAVLKNAIDWASRPVAGEPNLNCFIGKVVSLMSASPGKLGGIRGLVTLRSILGNIGCIVLPDQLCVSAADKAFRDDLQLTDPGLQKMLETICSDFVKLVQKIVHRADECCKANQAVVSK